MRIIQTASDFTNTLSQSLYETALTASNSLEPGQQLQLQHNHLEAPTSPPAPPSPAGNATQRVTCTETESGLSKRPLFYSHFPSSKPSFNFLYFIL